MNSLNYNRIQFLKSAAKFSDLPPDEGSEVAFAGRSNSGKSTTINAITGIARLARTSKTPGRTQLINFFELDADHRLVDLPGYGYADVPEVVKLRWRALLESYFSKRQSLQAVILLMDIRHPLKEFDWQMIEFAAHRKLPIHILLNKADKLGRGAASSALLGVRKALTSYQDSATIQLFSATERKGIEEVHQKLNDWLLEK